MAAGLFLLVLAAASYTSVRWGSKLDRVAALALVAASLCSIAADKLVAGTFARPEFGVAIVDLALLAFLIIVMRRSDKFWPIWAVGFHAISVVTHFVVLAAPGFLSTPYAVYSEWWGLPVVLSLLAGSFERPQDQPSRS